MLSSSSVAGVDPVAQFVGYFFQRGCSFFKAKLFVAGKDKKEMQLLPFGYLAVQAMLLKSPGFPQQSFDPVPAYGLFDPLFGDTEANTNRRHFSRSYRSQPENNTQRKNRKRLSGLEKRFNLLTQL